MTVVAAAGVEPGAARRANILTIEVLPDAKLNSASTAQHRLRLELRHRPHRGGVIRERVVAIVAGIIFAAAFHLDRNDVERRMPMRASRPRVHFDAAHRGPRHSGPVASKFASAATVR